MGEVSVGAIKKKGTCGRDSHFYSDADISRPSVEDRVASRLKIKTPYRKAM